MLAKLFRFHGHNSVRQSYRQGSSVRGSIASLHVRVDSRHPHFKTAVVVSKKVHKSAVVRNRIRRRVYEIVRINQPNMLRQAELVFTIYKVEVYDMPATELKKEIEDLLKRAKLL